jgi:uncharacterized membrane protein YfcA
MTILLGLAVTLGAGVALGLLGGGGSLLIVPALVYLFGRPPVEATAYSLLIVGGTSVVGTGLHQLRHPIPYRTVLTFGAVSVTSAYLVRAFVVPHLPPVLPVGSVAIDRDLALLLGFAGFAAAAGVAMIRTRCCAAGPHVHPVWVPIVGVLTGGLTAFFGAGGGFMVLPALVLLVGLPIEHAVGASLAVVAAQSLAGGIGAWTSMPAFDVKFALLLTVTMLVGVAWGVAVAARVPPARLRYAFGWLLLAVAAAMVVAELL